MKWRGKELMFMFKKVAAAIIALAFVAIATAFALPMPMVAEPINQVKFVIGQESYKVNEQVREMDTAPLIRNGRTYLPARWVAEAFGYKVGWDNATHTVLVGSQGRLPRPDLQQVGQKASSKPQLELLHEIPLGSVSADQIPDVTKDRWSFGVVTTRPVVSPDGKYVLAIGRDKMVLYNTLTGKRVWQKATYGGMDNYVVEKDRLYMTERYGYQRIEATSYVICLDLKTSRELWKYDVQKDLMPLVKKYMPADAPPSTWGYLKIVSHQDKLIVNGYNSWKKGKDTDKVEILLALNKQGKLLWKVKSHGYPGLWTMSEAGFINGKMVAGTYSYDGQNTPAYIHAFNLKNGRELWRVNLKHDNNLAHDKTSSATVAIVGNKIVVVAKFGKVYVLDESGKKLGEFTAFAPVHHKGTTICTTVSYSGVRGSERGVIIAPGKSIVKGMGYYSKAPVEHPDANSIKVFDLSGRLQWKFRLGGQVSNMEVKSNHLLLAALHNQDTLDYSYCGVYAFDLAREGRGEAKKSMMDRYLGYYQTDGVVMWNCLGLSDDGRVIAAATWPTRVGTKKYGKHALYILKLK